MQNITPQNSLANAGFVRLTHNDQKNVPLKYVDVTTGGRILVRKRLNREFAEASEGLVMLMKDDAEAPSTEKASKRQKTQSYMSLNIRHVFQSDEIPKCPYPKIENYRSCSLVEKFEITEQYYKYINDFGDSSRKNFCEWRGIDHREFKIIDQDPRQVSAENQQTRSLRRYSEAFKLEHLRRWIASGKPADYAERHNIRRGTFGSWTTNHIYLSKLSSES